MSRKNPAVPYIFYISALMGGCFILFISVLLSACAGTRDDMKSAGFESSSLDEAIQSEEIPLNLEESPTVESVEESHSEKRRLSTPLLANIWKNVIRIGI